jgi:serine/threonine-protein kinase RsbW
MGSTTLPVTIRLDIPAAHKYLHLVGACIGGLLERMDDLAEPEQTRYNLQLAAQEVCSNIVNHAYGAGSHAGDEEACSGDRIIVELVLEPQPLRMIVRLYDTGQPFDPQDVSEPDLDAMPVGGLGLFLARELLDELAYSRSDDENCWQLIKTLGARTSGVES